MKHANLAIFVPHVGCPNACSFCNQKTISGTQIPPSPEQVTQICTEALATAERFDAEIAFFGGSFTAIPKELMVSLLSAASPFVGEGKFRGIRISTRPDAVDDEILRLLKQYHVTAIELGCQSMIDSVLKINDRGHLARHVVDAAKLIRTQSFELGLQMMTGLYKDSDEGSMYTARQIAQLQPDTVRIYPTIVVKNTRLEQYYKEGYYIPQTVEQATKLCAELLLFFRKQKIHVIRVGLHAEPTLMKEMIAGPFHPAFGELCENQLFFQRVMDEIQIKGVHKGEMIVFVNPSDLSKMVGQSRRNIVNLKQLGYTVKIKTDSKIQKNEIKLELEEVVKFAAAKP